jgi:AraC family transcriptional regulator
MDDLAKAPAKLSAHRREYERRVYRVMDYIQAHLDEDLTLEKLAAVAAFSPFHFHRVFAAITGETLSDFIRRVRLERAASALAIMRDTSVLDVALRCGFSSAATFARAFKSHFGMSATEWRQGGAQRWYETRPGQRKKSKANSNRSQVQRNPRKASLLRRGQGVAARNREAAKELRMPVEIKDIPPYRVAYMRHVGPYGEGGRISALWASFERWIRTRDLVRPGLLTIGIGHDAPKIAPADKLRYDACVVVDQAFKADRFVNIADLPGGKYAVAAFDGTAAEISDAWEQLWAVWLPASGYQPEDRPCLELRQDFAMPPGSHLRCGLCLPIGPL